MGLTVERASVCTRLRSQPGGTSSQPISFSGDFRIVNWLSFWRSSHFMSSISCLAIISAELKCVKKYILSKQRPFIYFWLFYLFSILRESVWPFCDLLLDRFSSLSLSLLCKSFCSVSSSTTFDLSQSSVKLSTAMTLGCSLPDESSVSVSSNKNFCCVLGIVLQSAETDFIMTLHQQYTVTPYLFFSAKFWYSSLTFISLTLVIILMKISVNFSDEKFEYLTTSDKIFFLRKKLQI